MMSQNRCKSCGESLPRDAQFCNKCGAAAPRDQQSGSIGLGKLGKGVLDTVKDVSDLGNERRPSSGASYGGEGQGLQSVTFQSKQECEQWRYQMGSTVNIVNVIKNKQRDMFGGKHKTYTVTYRSSQQPPMQSPQPTAPAAPAPQEEQASGSADVTEQIKKLAELRDQGILTDEEFQVKKKELLAKL
jgi:Short C-terminal domain/zinc-ribbon domain